eukprot:112654_1
MVEELKDYHIVQIDCGAERHYCAISKGGKLFTWGNNKDGQCGLGKGTEQEILIPTQVDLNGGVIASYVSCSDKHTLLLTTNGAILSFGSGTYGKLGHGDQELKYKP